MNGAESLVHTAVAAGVRVCFANPGTTELALVAAPTTSAAIGRCWACTRTCAPARPTDTRASPVPPQTLFTSARPRERRPRTFTTRGARARRW